MSVFELILTGGILVAVTIVSAAVSALETALFCVKEHHVAAIAEGRPDLKGIVRAIARQPRRSISQALFLSSVLNLSIAVLALFLLREFDPLLPGRPILSAALLLGGIILFGDLIPTLLAVVIPGGVLRLMLKRFVWISPVLERISGRLEKVTDLLSRLLIPSGVSPSESLSDEEIETLVEMRREDGVLLPSESGIIQEIIRLGNKTVKDCMTPRVDATLAPNSATNDELIEMLQSQSEWHWQVPVYEESPDIVTGILDLRQWLRSPKRPYQDFIGPPVFVPETMMALDAFRDYLSRPRSLAIVLDEYGGVEGVISHSDLIEEILEEAAPTASRDGEIEDLGNGRLLVAGDARLDEIGESLGLDLEQEGLDTIGGLVFNELGHLPEPGMEIDLAGLRIAVLKCEAQRIIELAVEKRKEGETAKEDSTGTVEESSIAEGPEASAGSLNR